jgi:hypothetical protein
MVPEYDGEDFQDIMSDVSNPEFWGDMVSYVYTGSFSTFHQPGCIVEENINEADEDTGLSGYVFRFSIVSVAQNIVVSVFGLVGNM